VRLGDEAKVVGLAILDKATEDEEVVEEETGGEN